MENSPLVGDKHRGQESNRGGLAGPIWAQKPDDFSPGCREADVLDGTTVPVVFGESHRFHGHAGHWPAWSYRPLSATRSLPIPSNGHEKKMRTQLVSLDHLACRRAEPWSSSVPSAVIGHRRDLASAISEAPTDTVIHHRQAQSA